MDTPEFQSIRSFPGDDLKIAKDCPKFYGTFFGAFKVASNLKNNTQSPTYRYVTECSVHYTGLYVYKT